MKNLVCTLLSVSLLLSCSKGGGDGEDLKNTAPTIPGLIFPSNNKLCIDNSVNFQWVASTDIEKNSVKYQLQVASDNQFTQIVSTKETTGVNQLITLEKGKAYYWRIKAIDSNNLSSDYSSIYSFYTEGLAQSNHLPFLPQLVQPAISSSVSSTTVDLKWSASDVDANDVLSYDVYLGTTNPPTQKVATAISQTVYKVNDIVANKNYYWKVVVKDNKGGETIGQIWSFKSN